MSRASTSAATSSSAGASPRYKIDARFARRVDLTISAPPPRPAAPLSKGFAETVSARPKPTEVVVAPRPTSDGRRPHGARCRRGALLRPRVDDPARVGAAREGELRAHVPQARRASARPPRENELRHQIVRQASLLPAPPRVLGVAAATDALFARTGSLPSGRMAMDACRARRSSRPTPAV